MIFCKMNVFLAYVLMFAVAQAAEKSKLKPMLMPDVQPRIPNEYLCTAFKMTRPEFIVEFSPSAPKHILHHIVIFACEYPGLKKQNTPRLVWNCNYQDNNTEPRQWSYINANACNKNPRIIYTWSLEAPQFTLPEGVGLRVGKGTGINYLVLQVHYLHVDKFLQGKTDKSGVVITVLPGSSRRVTKTAGLYLLGTAVGTIMPHEKVNIEAACRMEEQVVIHPFAFHPHTHDLGLMVSGFKIDRDGNWHLIGKRSPQKMQIFFPVEDPDLTIGYGDMIAARCTMYNFRDVSTSIGESANDEMCNFYMMYWVDRDHPMKEWLCFSDGPQMYSWKTDVNISGVSKEIDRLASEENIHQTFHNGQFNILV